MTFLETLNNSEKYIKSGNTTAYVGMDHNRNEILLDMAEATHVLVAGSTGSGKSVMLHSIVSSLMYKNTRETAKFLMIDPKRVEFFDYADSSMLYGGEIFDDEKEAVSALSAVLEEMDKRYSLMKYKHMRSIEDDECENMQFYRIYIVIDELSVLMQSEERKEVISNLRKIAMLGRAAGIHLIVATQHPNRKTIPAEIQSNIPTVIGMAVRQAVDSRMIIGNGECTKLRGRGDAILVSGLDEIHFQGAYVSREDVQEIVNDTMPTERSFKNTIHVRYSGFGSDKYMN